MPSRLAQLAAHFDALRRAHPDDGLLVLVDVDPWLDDLGEDLAALLGEAGAPAPPPAEATEERRELAVLLGRLGLEPGAQAAALEALERDVWSRAAAPRSGRAQRGLLELLRWFTVQPGAHVLLGTARPERERADVARALRLLGARQRLRFAADQLLLDDDDGGSGALRSRVAALRDLREQGWRLAAVVDADEDDLLALVAGVDQPGLFAATPKELGLDARDGRQGAAPVQVVWSDVATPSRLQGFLGSSVAWAEVPVVEASSGELVAADAIARGERPIALSELIGAFAQFGKGLRVVPAAGGAHLARVVHALAASGFPRELTAFRVSPDRVGRDDLARLAEDCEGARLECSVGFLTTLAALAPDLAREAVDRLAADGVRRFSVPFAAPRRESLRERLVEWGHEVDLDGADGLVAYLGAVRLGPASVTGDLHAGAPELRAVAPSALPGRAGAARSGAAR